MGYEPSGRIYDSNYTIEQEPDSAHSKTVEAIRRVGKKVKKTNKFKERLQEIEEQAAYKAYRFEQESKKLPIKAFWEWQDDKVQKKLKAKQRFNEFMYETPAGLATILFGLAIFGFCIFAHSVHLMNIP